MALSICILGTGHIARKHSGLIRGLFPNFSISVASRDLARAQKFQADNQLAKSYGSYEEAISADVDIIVIATPPNSHLDLIKKSIAANKHILIEKPAVGSLSELLEIQTLLKNYDKTVMVAENQVFDPFYLKIRSLIKNNDWGRPVLLELTRLGQQKSQGWRQDQNEMARGALHEGGAHWIRKLLDLASLFEKNPHENLKSLQAFSPPFLLSNTPNEDTTYIVARHASGLTSRLFHSWGIPHRSGLLDFSKIIMEKGAIYFESRGLIGFSFGTKRKIILPSLFDNGGYKGMWKHFIDCVLTGKKPLVSMKDIEYDFNYMEAAYCCIKNNL